MDTESLITMNNALNKNSKIYVAGHKGLVGSAIIRTLEENGYHNLLLRTRSELDLMDQNAVNAFMMANKPDFMFVSAARVGGIYANSTYPAEFIHDNLVIETNLIHAAYKSGMQQLIFLGSSCIYPRECPQPIKEEYLLTGPLEKTNESYAIAKIAGIKLCESYNRQYGTYYLSLMPTNLYGPNDNFDLNNSHVLPALIRKAHESKKRGDAKLIVWGSGQPMREFLYVDDLANACCYFMQWLNSAALDMKNIPSLINIGAGKDISIRALAELVCEITNFDGNLEYDVSKPDGTPKKLLDVNRSSELGWTARTSLREGITKSYQWFIDETDSAHV